jgi:metabolite-proton symporter
MATIPANSARRVAFASLIGTTIEWYDFFIYGTAAALVFNQLFFPQFDPVAGTVAAFATFAIGFIARPFGGALFAHFGDKVGRKPMLIWSLLLMGISTLLMGFLPTYGAIGVGAPILLTLLRFCQGLGVGGEWGGAALMAVEHAPGHRRGFYGSFPQVGVPAGLLLGNLTFSALSANLTDEQFTSWGWRIPFLFSAVLIVVGFIIRLKISESPVFQKAVQHEQQAHRNRMPVLEVLRTHPKTIALAAGSFLATNATFYVGSTWIVSYATKTLDYDRTSVLNANSVLSFIDIPLMVAFGLLSDHVGRRGMALSAMAVLAAFSVPYFMMVDSGSITLFLAGGLLVQACRTAVYGPQSAYYAELFSTRLRYSGASLSYQIASILGGGIAPMICTALYGATKTSLSIALYVAGLCLISLVSTYLLAETYRRELADEQTDAANAGALGRAVPKTT